ncbi:glycosyltransferase [Candidatus Woesearchaeota archaeon]|nr:glycosyltransferase [Candidatus Woesearchaeota archaeon]
MNIDQITPCITKKGDAISNYTLEIRELLIKSGFDSQIYVEHSDFGISSFIKNYRSCKPKKDDIVIFHASVGSSLTEFFRNLSCKKVMIYHNFTPAYFFYGINEQIAVMLENYPQEIYTLVGQVDLVLCDSEFNRREIENIGFAHALESPIFLDFNRLKKANPELLEKFQDGLINLLHVGRIIPNKKIEDIIRIFYYYKQFINPKSRLFLIGQISDDAKEYYFSLKRYIDELQLKEVYFTNGVPDADLAAYYQAAHIYLTMSEHEGMCLPLLEAMYCGVPVIGHHAAAVPFTLRNAGILVKEKNTQYIAELIDIILNDKKLRQKILASQKERLTYFYPERLKKEFLGHILNLKKASNAERTKNSDFPLRYLLKHSFNLKQDIQVPDSYSYLFQHPESLSEIKILYIQPKGVGDIIMSTPIIRELKRKYPFAKIDFAADDFCKDIVGGNPYINNVYSFGNLPNLQGYVTVLRPYLKTQYMINWQDTGMHIVDLYASLCGVKLDSYKTEIFPIEANLKDYGINEKEDYICLHTESSLKYKDWPHFRELIHKLKDIFNIVVIDEQQHNYENTIQLPKDIGLRKKAYVVSKSKMLIGVDSMGIHMSSAFNVPTIALYGNTLPELCKPLSNKNLITIKPEKRCTDGWHHYCKEGKYCISNITVDDILKKVDEVMVKCKVS